MPIFGQNQSESIVGVDIGNSAIKIVELENVKKQPKLLTYGYIEQPNELIHSNSDESKQAVVRALQKVWDASHVKSKQVVASLPSYTVFSSIIHLPQMKKKELAEAVQWEAQKFVPMPLSEMVLDWKILDEKVFKSSYVSNESTFSGASGPSLPTAVVDSDGAAMIQSRERSFYKILLTAAPRDIIGRYVEVFQKARLQLVGLETESFAAERSLIGNDPGPAMIIDIGAVATNFSIVVDGVPIISRSIDVAGNTMTKSIANSLNVSMEEAEQFKRDFGLAPQHETQQGQPVRIPRHLEGLMSAILNEIQYVLGLYQSQTNGPIEKIVLTGGSAWLPYMTDYIHQQLGVKVFIGDPWARVQYPQELRDVLVEVGPRLSVAIGLAMRNIVADVTAKKKE